MVNRRWPPGPASSGVTTPVSLTRWPSKCSWPPNTSAKAVIGIPTPLPHRGNCVVSFVYNIEYFFWQQLTLNLTYLYLTNFLWTFFMFFLFQRWCKNNVIVLYVYSTFKNSYLWMLSLTCTGILSLADNSDQVFTLLPCLYCTLFSSTAYFSQTTLINFQIYKIIDAQCNMRFLIQLSTPSKPSLQQKLI